MLSSNIELTLVAFTNYKQVGGEAQRFFKCNASFKNNWREINQQKMLLKFFNA